MVIGVLRAIRPNSGARLRCFACLEPPAAPCFTSGRSATAPNPGRAITTYRSNAPFRPPAPCLPKTPALGFFRGILGSSAPCWPQPHQVAQRAISTLKRRKFKIKKHKKKKRKKRWSRMSLIPWRPAPESRELHRSPAKVRRLVKERRARNKGNRTLRVPRQR